MKIVFMGSSEFSLKGLEALYELTREDENYEIAAVYSQPPKPFGRGYKLKKSITHEFAEKKEIPVFTPKSLRKPEQEEIFRSLGADVAVVSSYGLIIPQNILDIPPKGFINIHGSLLPRWRGASPMQSSILAGDSLTGITIMKMDAGIDTGDIISKESVKITEKTNYGQLAETLGNLGAKMIVNTIKNLDDALANSEKQPSEGVTLSQKFSKEDCRIDWNKSALEIQRKIMALSPSPAAWFEIKGLRIKVIDAEVADSKTEYESAVGLIQKDKNPVISCESGYIKLLTIQPAGKNAMSGDSFLRGHSELIGSIAG